MNKIALIARSEYLRRVRSKMFVLTTLLAPVLALSVVVLPVLMASVTDGDTTRTIHIVDETGQMRDALTESLPETYIVQRRAASPIDSLRAEVLDGRLDGYFVIPEGVLEGRAEATYYSRGGGGLAQQGTLRSSYQSVVRETRIRAAGADDIVLALLDARASLDTVTLSEEGDAAGGVIASSIVAYVLGLLIYISVLLYGVMVMRGVIEEKSNRIIEVIASSARPFELMMGKVLGIGAMGLTQLLAWSALMVAMSMAAGPVLALVLSPEIASTPGVNIPEGVNAADLPFDPSDLPAMLGSLLSPALMLAFVGFFLGGYLLFSALFAAVGSAVDQESDAQSLQLPIMMPIILPVFFLPAVLTTPDSTFSVFLSIFPFSSPILMVVRMASTTVPAWQVLLSFALLIATFVLRHTSRLGTTL